jgi:hypothetical protein
MLQVRTSVHRPFAERREWRRQYWKSPYVIAAKDSSARHLEEEMSADEKLSSIAMSDVNRRSGSSRARSSARAAKKR